MNAGLDLGNHPSAITPEQSGAEYAELIIKSTRAEQGGKFLGQGTEGPLPW
jgi:norsolorinic acid ketoreductase